MSITDQEITKKFVDLPHGYWIYSFIRENDFQDHYYLHLIARNPHQTGPDYEGHIQWTKRDNTTFFDNWVSDIAIVREGAQRLMDQLWQMGFRPTHEADPDRLAGYKSQVDYLQKLNTRLVDYILDRPPMIYPTTLERIEEAK